MKKNIVVTLAVFGLFLFSANTVTAQNVPDDPEERRVYYHLHWTLPEIEEVQKQVGAYTSGSRNALYTYKSDDTDWGLIAVSPRARDAYSKTHDLTKWRQANPGNKFDAALDALAASLAKKLPADIPTGYNVRPGLALEKMMKDTLKNLATIKIFKIGLYQDAWYIDKNQYGIPTARYVHGLIWARDPSADHPYCRTYAVNIIQTYTGGGNYGSSYAVLVGGSNLVGCPAGAK